MRTTIALASVFLSVTVSAAGCLSTSHVIPKRELQALAQQPPAQRGAQVRVIQGFASEDSPPEQRRVSSTTAVIIVPGGGHHHGGHGGGVRSGRTRRAPNSAKTKADKAWVWVIIAAGVAIGVAATEGARYDGWVQLNPMHPVHLWGPNGEYTWMPLAQIDPATAAWARKAIVRPSEGPWRELGRAPLNRRGWSYAMTLGSTQLPSVLGTEETGFMSHIQLGVFPDQHIGILADVGLGWANNSIDATIFEQRYAAELQFFPVSAGKLHAGVFGQVGIGNRTEDGPKEVDRRDTFFGLGALLQLELTTRLALTGRAGATTIFGSTVSDIGIGLSIY